MKKSQEMIVQLQHLIAESKVLMNKEGVRAEEIEGKIQEISALKAKIAMQETLEAQEKEELELETMGTEIKSPIKSEVNYNQIFLNALCGIPLTAKEQEVVIKNSLSSGSGEDGGLLIPHDQQTKINELKRDFEGLEGLVNVEKVSTVKGSRVLEKNAINTPFVNISENEKIPDTDSPQFVPLQYNISDYAGILPVPNNLLNDTKALQQYLMKWLAKKDVATRNGIILKLLKNLTKRPISHLDDIKTILNVELDPSIERMGKIIMNQDSFNKFDQMRDSIGKYIMQPDPTNPTKKLLAGKKVRKYSNFILPTRVVGNKKFAPVIIGNFKEAITLFDRQQMSILATNIGAGAFENNQTKFRAIIRLDVKEFDKEALIFGEIEI